MVGKWSNKISGRKHAHSNVSEDKNTRSEVVLQLCSMTRVNNGLYAPRQLEKHWNHEDI